MDHHITPAIIIVHKITLKLVAKCPCACPNKNVYSLQLVGTYHLNYQFKTKNRTKITKILFLIALAGIVVHRGSIAR